jgi:hypothetical protein
MIANVQTRYKNIHLRKMSQEHPSVPPGHTCDPDKHCSKLPTGTNGSKCKYCDKLLEGPELALRDVCRLHSCLKVASGGMGYPMLDSPRRKSS